MLTVVSPHLDDAVLSLWSVLTAHPGALVITVFAGVPDADRPLGEWDRRCGFTDPAQACRARREADLEALARCGATAVHLDHLDHAYTTRPPAGTSRLVTDELRDLLAGAESVWLPVGLGLHPDHRLVGRAVLAAADRVQSAVHVYADQPYASVWGWPHWVLDGGPPSMPAAWTRFPLRARTRTPGMQWSAALAHHGLRRSLPNVVRPLTPPEVEAKLHALEPYREQTAHLSYGPYGSWSLAQAMAYESWWALPRTARSTAS